MRPSGWPSRRPRSTKEVHVKKVASLLFFLICTSWMPSAAQEEKAVEDSAQVVTSRISRVLVYSDRALVTRASEAVRVGAGRTRFAFDELPGSLSDASVRASLPASSAAKIANIEIEPRYKTTYKKEEAEKAAEEVKTLEARLRELSERRAIVVGEANFLGGISFGTRPPASAGKAELLPLVPDSWARMLDFFGEKFRSAAQRERTIAEQIDDANADIVVARAKLRMLQSYRTTHVKRVILEIDSPRETQAPIDVSYMVAGPAWYPRYDVRANVAAGTLELTAHALVRQETGEDWQDVEISFSASEPSHAADLPRLASWRIGAPEESQVMFAGVPPPPPAPQVSQEDGVPGGVEPAPEMKPLAMEEEPAKPSPAPGFVAPADKKKAAPADAARTGRYKQNLDRIEGLYKAQQEARQRGDVDQFTNLNQALDWELQTQGATVQRALGAIANEVTSNLQVAQRLQESQRLGRGLVPPIRSSGGYDYRYAGQRIEDIPSDGALTKIVILKTTADVELTYEVAPEKSKTAFLRTRLTNTTPSPLLAGPASVFLASDFVGETDLPTCAPSEDVEIGLGSDEEIAVRRDVERKRDTRGVFGSAYRYNVTVDDTIVNNKQRPVTITLFDRVPFTFDDELKIKETSADPAPTARDPKGLMRWTLQLAPREKRTISVGYSYEHKSSRRVFLQEDASVRW